MRDKLPLDEIRAEIDRQLDRFESVMARPPDFVDGHQHVHVLPGVREALIEALLRDGSLAVPGCADTGDGLHRIALRRAHARKALAVRALASGFKRAANWSGFAINDSFAGFSDFHPGKDYAKSFATYLRAPGRRHLVMCHPGHVDEELTAQDPVTITREQELAFLLSPRLPEMLAERGLKLARLSAAFRPHAP